MHTSLRLSTNAALMALNGLVCIGCFAAAMPSWQLLLLAPFAAVGLYAGRCQSNSIELNPSNFKSLSTWAAVRSQLMQSTAGKTSIVMQWLCGASVLMWLFFANSIDNPAIPVAAYAAFGFTREAGSYKGLRLLSQLA